MITEPELLMRKVLHYKTNYLNKSETFINRLVRNHQTFEPEILCYRKRAFTDGLVVHESPARGFAMLANTAAFHLNLSLPWYKETIRRVKPDVLHAHFGYDAYKLIDIAGDENLPLVTSFYGSDVARLPSEIGWKRRYRKLAAAGSAFIAASDFMKTQLEALGFPVEKITVVRFGLQLDDLHYKKEGRDLNSVMMVGRMVEKKGFEHGLKALSLLINNGYPLSVHIFGDGPLLSTLRKLASGLGIMDNITFHGFQSVEKILEAHRQHGVLLAPSITANDGDMEGLPNTILEAMAKGTVVVATKHAAIPEAIIHEQTGFLAEEKDVEGLSGILKSILDSTHNLDAIRKRARQKIELEYSIQRMAAGVESVYQKAISGT